jgi:hypothetical protein
MPIKLQNLVLITKNTSGKVDTIYFNAKNSTYAVREPMSISLVDQRTNKLPADLIYKRKGNSLIIELQNGESIEIENFYSENTTLFNNASFSGDPVDLSSNVAEVSAQTTTTHSTSAGLATVSNSAGGPNHILPILGGLGFVGAVASGLTSVGSACDATRTFSGGVVKCVYAAGNTDGSYSYSFDVTTETAQSASVGAVKVAGASGVSNAEVLKSIVALIASINKQIQALQKLILKR